MKLMTSETAKPRFLFNWNCC